MVIRCVSQMVGEKLGLDVWSLQIEKLTDKSRAFAPSISGKTTYQVDLHFDIHPNFRLI